MAPMRAAPTLDELNHGLLRPAPGPAGGTLPGMADVFWAFFTPLPKLGSTTLKRETWERTLRPPSIRSLGRPGGASPSREHLSFCLLPAWTRPGSSSGPGMAGQGQKKDLLLRREGPPHLPGLRRAMSTVTCRATQDHTKRYFMELAGYCGVGGLRPAVFLCSPHSFCFLNRASSLATRTRPALWALTLISRCGDKNITTF